VLAVSKNIDGVEINLNDLTDKADLIRIGDAVSDAHRTDTVYAILMSILHLKIEVVVRHRSFCTFLRELESEHVLYINILAKLFNFGFYEMVIVNCKRILDATDEKLVLLKLIGKSQENLGFYEDALQTYDFIINAINGRDSSICEMKANLLYSLKWATGSRSGVTSRPMVPPRPALMMALPIDQLRIVIYDNKNEILDRSRLPEEATFLESLRPAISLLCRLKLLTLIGLRGVWCFIVVALIVGTSCLFVYLMYLYRVRLSEANTCKNAELSRILSRLSEMLKDQLRYSESHPGTEPYLPLDKLRILLQQSYPKLHDNQLWENVNEALFCNGEDVQTGKVPRCIVARKSRFEEIPRFITFTRCFEPKLSYEAYDLTVHEYKKMRERDGAGGNQST